MSSSSFGTVIGTPRDQIPKLPVSNYANTSVDLTKSAAERNDDHKQDLKDMLAAVTEIETLRHNDTWNNIAGLEQFTAAGATLFQKRNADKESRETIKRYSNINSEELLRANDLLTDLSKLEEADRINQLEKIVRNGSPAEKQIALDLLTQNVLPTGEEIIFNDAKDRFDRVLPSTFNSLAEKNYLLSKNTLADAQLVGDNAIRDILTDIYYELDLAGFDINSRKVQNYINTKVLPTLYKENERQLKSWQAFRPQIVQQNIKKENKSEIERVFTQKGSVTTVNDEGIEETSIQNTGNFNNLLEGFIIRNPTVENKADAIKFMIDLLENNPNLKNKIKLGDLNYFLYDADIIDDTQNGKVVKGFLNTKTKGVEAAEKFFMKYKSEIAETNSAVFEDIKKVMATEVREFLRENKQDRLKPGQQLHFITKYNNMLRAEGLSTNLPVPSFLQGDETIYDKFSYETNLQAVGSINKKDWEAAYRSRTENRELPLTINTQVDKAKAELTRQVLEAKAKDDNANIDDLVEQLYPTILDDLVLGKFAGKQDKLRPLLPKDTEKEISSLKVNIDKWLGNKEVNSIYEKRYLDQYIEEYMGKGFLPSNIPTYIKKLAAAAGLTPHQYVMSRVKAIGVYDEKTMKFVSDKNPEDIFNLNEEEKKYIFIKPMSSKNVLLFNKNGGLNGKKTKDALLALRQRGRNVDSYEGRGNLKKLGAFFAPGDQTITVEKAYNLAKEGKGTNFGLYGISAKDMIRLVDAGILDPNAEFDENTQDFAAFGLIYLQANDGNSIMGAQTEALDWRYLTGLNEATQAQVLIFFPNLRDMPMNQFHNLQKDVSNAILSDVKERRKATVEDLGLTELVDKYPSLKERLIDREDGSGILPRRFDNNTVKDILDFTRPRSSDPKYLEWAANDEGHIALRKYFQEKIRDGKYVDNGIRRLLQQSRVTYDKYGAGDSFDYFQNPNKEE